MLDVRMTPNRDSAGTEAGAVGDPDGRTKGPIWGGRGTDRGARGTEMGEMGYSRFALRR